MSLSPDEPTTDEIYRLQWVDAARRLGFPLGWPQRRARPSISCGCWDRSRVAMQWPAMTMWAVSGDLLDLGDVVGRIHGHLVRDLVVCESDRRDRWLVLHVATGLRLPLPGWAPFGYPRHYMAVAVAEAVPDRLQSAVFGLRGYRGDQHDASVYGDYNAMRDDLTEAWHEIIDW